MNKFVFKRITFLAKQNRVSIGLDIFIIDLFYY